MLGWYLLEPQAEMLGACKKKTLDRELLSAKSSIVFQLIEKRYIIPSPQILGKSPALPLPSASLVFLQHLIFASCIWPCGF